MSVGLSTYAFFWRMSAQVGDPLSLEEVVDETAAAGAEVLQICDHPELVEHSATQLAALRARGAAAGVAFEVGFRGVRALQLDRFLEVAVALGAGVVRTMLASGDDRPAPFEAVAELRVAAPRFADAGVRLGLETYEACSTEELVRVVEEVGDPGVGICLDPANMVARLEHPSKTIDRAAAHVVNLHVKDFTFRRAPGLVGFSLVGCELGTGLLDVGYLYGRVRPRSRGISEIVEHWLPWQGSAQATVETEARWTAHSLAAMGRLGV